MTGSVLGSEMRVLVFRNTPPTHVGSANRICDKDYEDPHKCSTWVLDVPQRLLHMVSTDNDTLVIGRARMELANLAGYLTLGLS